MRIILEANDSVMNEGMLDTIRSALNASLKSEVTAICKRVVKAKEAELIALANKELSNLKITATKSAVKPKGGKRAKV